MDITLAYGNASLTVTVPVGVDVDSFGSNTSGTSVTRESFSRRFHDSPARQVLPASSPLVVVNDGYRHTPTARILDWLDSIYPDFLDRADFIVSTGTHPAPSDEQMRAIFGGLYARLRDRVRIHDCRDMTAMRPVGRDRFGAEVFLNAAVLEHEDVLIIGSVEPHYFAGFTGGRKSLFPGLSDLATTERNHNLANSLEAQPLRLRGNPVAEHFDELMELVAHRAFYAVQVVVDAGGIIREITCGELQDAFVRATEAARALFAHEVAERYDVVLCEMRSPLDHNLYQLQKGLENGQAAVRAGGAAILVSACVEGVGSPHFFHQALTWDRTRNRPQDGILRFGSHKLSRVHAITERIDVLLHSMLSPQDIRQVFYEPIENVTAYLTERRASYDLDRLAVVYDAGHTVLTVNDN